MGMATNIPPHNLSEVIACLMCENPEVELSELLTVVSGPDSDRGIINGRTGIVRCLSNRSRSNLCPSEGRSRGGQGRKEKIVITEIPYQLN